VSLGSKLPQDKGQNAAIPEIFKLIQGIDP
jgi:hypothetical protein